MQSASPHYEQSGYIVVRPSIVQELDRRKAALGAVDYSDLLSRLLHPVPSPAVAPIVFSPPAAVRVAFRAPAPARLRKKCPKVSKDGAFQCRRTDAPHNGKCRTWGRGGARDFVGIDR